MDILTSLGPRDKLRNDRSVIAGQRFVLTMSQGETVSQYPSPTFLKTAPEKQQAILDAAVAEFGTYGYHQASINRLVNRLGIAKGSIFQYFGTKQGLFDYVFAQAKDAVSQHLRCIREHTRDRDFFTRLRTVVHSGLVFVRENPGFYRLYMHVLRDEHLPGRAGYLLEVRAASRAYLAGLVDQGLANTELDPDLSQEWSVVFVDTLLDRFFQVMSEPDGDEAWSIIPVAPDHEHVQTLIRFIHKGLGK
jgi:AcrR family transcriptional regulator